MIAKDYGLELKYCAPGGQAGNLLLEADHRITGYASLFGCPDQGGDVVCAGAYQRGLARLEAEGGRVKMLWQHDPGQPIGVWDEIREDAHGLFVRGRLLPEVARAGEALSLIKAGAIDGLSIGYKVRRATKTAQGQRLLEELELWEVSVVTFPMLREARVAAKAACEMETLAQALQATATKLADR